MISAVVLSKNEEENVKDCLEGLKWCDEIIVVDDNSEDKTWGVARGMGAKVLTNSLNGDFASQRNFALRQAQGEWVFFVDADERVEQELAEEIKEAIKDPSITGYLVKRKDFIFGRWLNHGETAGVKLLRLARKGAGRWARPVHEVWDIKGEIDELENPLLHYPHPTVEDFLQNINFYTDLRARQLYHQGAWAGVEAIILYPLGKFLLNYFLKLGFLDGMAGFLVASMMSFHSFLTRGKLWFQYRQMEK